MPHSSLPIAMDKHRWICARREVSVSNCTVCGAIRMKCHSEKFSRLDLAKQRGQNETITPFEEHHRLPTLPMINQIGSLSTQSVVDIRELQFERCLYSNCRKEVTRHE